MMTEPADTLQSTTWRSRRTLDAYLKESFGLAGEIAGTMCIQDSPGRQGCAWYHAAWQYLRLVDLISSPTWHDGFYREAISTRAGSGGFSQIAVTGPADYSILEYAIPRDRSCDGAGRLAVINRCPTPLVGCLWFAKQIRADIVPIRADLLAAAPLLQGNFDIVCTDAFLTRFPQGTVSRILDAWHQMLRPNGVVVTTVRVGQTAPESDQAEDYITEFINRWSLLGLEPSAPNNEAISMAREFAGRRKSHLFGSTAELLRLVSKFFTVDYLDEAEIQGGLSRTTYCRLVLRREPV